MENLATFTKRKKLSLISGDCETSKSFHFRIFNFFGGNFASLKKKGC
jgi:hypothetical protein